MATTYDSHDKKEDRSQQLIESAEEGNMQELLSLIIEDADYSITDQWGGTLLHHAAVNKTTSEVITHLLSKGTPVNVRSKDGRTPVHECASRGNLRNMALLVEAGANIHARDDGERTALHFAARSDSCIDIAGCHLEENFPSQAIIEYLLQQGMEIDLKDKKGQTPLFYCASRGTPRNLQFLIANGADLKAKADHGRTVLHAAVTNEKGSEIIQYLLNEHFDVNEETVDGKTPILVCAHLGNISNMQLLLDNGANILAKDKNGCTALHAAASNKDAKMVEFLITRGIEINSTTDDGATALHLAAGNPGGTAIVECLIANGAALDQRDRRGRTALNCCASRGNSETMKLLLDNGADLLARDKNGLTALHAAALNERGAYMIHLLTERGISVNTITYDGATALHLACRNPAGVHIVECLLNHGAVPDDMTKTGRTALHVCASRGNLEIMKLLLEHGANIQATDINRTTALHVAAFNEKGVEMVDFLIEQGIPVNSKTDGDATPLHFACGNPAGYDIVKCLLKHGALLDNRMRNGRTALLSCAFGGSLKMMQLLLEHGANIEDRDGKGTSVLHAAAFNERGAEMIEFIIERGISVNSTDNERATPLYFAAGNAAGYEIVKCLLKHGASPGEATKFGRTPLHSCAYRGNIEVMRLLVEAGSTVDAVNGHGFCALHCAAENEAGEEMIDFLLTKGIPIDVRTSTGVTPLHLSCESGTLKNAQLLLDRGADPNAADMKGRRMRFYARNMPEIQHLLDQHSSWRRSR